MESGPIVERKQAYVVVRHTKFGLSKKGGGKKLKLVGDTVGQVQNSTAQPIVDSCPELPEEDSAESGLEDEEGGLFNEDDSPLSFPMRMQDKHIEEKKVAWSVLDSSCDFNEVFSLSDEKNGPASTSTNGIKPSMLEKFPSPGNGALDLKHQKPMFDSSRADTIPPFHPEHPRGTENRYKRNEPRSPFPPPNKMMESVQSETRLPRERQPPLHVNTSSSRLAAETKQMPKQQPLRPGVPNPPGTSYGIFSNPNANSHREQDAVANIHCNRDGYPNGPGPASNSGSAGAEAQKKFQSSKSDVNQRTGRCGMFSGESSNVIQQNK